MSARRLTVAAAIVANASIALIKGIAAAASGSAALFSESLHSLVDTGDGVLLAVGIRLSHRPASPRHPYGRGAEVYFWSMVVAMSIFGVGGGLSIYEGIEHAIAGHAPTHLAWSYAVLGTAFLFEGASWVISLRGFRKHHRRHRLWKAIRASKDPTTFAIILEDSAALIGIAIAVIGLTLTALLHDPIYDAISSMLIGVVLLLAGLVLGRETWSLLLGESADREVVESIQQIARAHAGVRAASRPRTMHVGPDVVHVDLDLALEPSASAVDTLREIEHAVRERHREVRRVAFCFPLEVG